MKAKDVLINKQAQIMRSAELLAQEINDWQTIQSYVTKRVHEIELSPLQQKKLDRYQFIYNQLVTGKYTDTDVCEMLKDAYNIELTQALKDLRDSKELFNTAFNVKKQFEIKLQLEINRMMLEKANLSGDLRSYAALEKNRANLIKMLPEEEQSVEDFRGHENIIVFDPAALGYDPLNEKELLLLYRDLKKKYGGEINIPGLNIEEAEIIEENRAEEDTL